MKWFTGDSTIELFEHLIDEENQVVTHLVIKAGQTVPEHGIHYSVIVVPIKGRVLFSDTILQTEIFPGKIKIVQLIPHERLSLKGIEDSELIVVKSVLLPIKDSRPERNSG